MWIAEYINTNTGLLYFHLWLSIRVFWHDRQGLYITQTRWLEKTKNPYIKVGIVLWCNTERHVNPCPHAHVAFLSWLFNPRGPPSTLFRGFVQGLGPSWGLLLGCGVANKGIRLGSQLGVKNRSGGKLLMMTSLKKIVKCFWRKQHFLYD